MFRFLIVLLGIPLLMAWTIAKLVFIGLLAIVWLVVKGIAIAIPGPNVNRRTNRSMNKAFKLLS